MTRKLLTGNAAAAWGARLANVEYMPVFPITPQTEIIETLAAWIDEGDMPGRLVTMESEHSMIAAAAAGAATGVRTFTATSSQGLLYGLEMIFTVSGWRAPFVLVNVSRGLATPVTLEPDHNDVLAARDSGFLQIHCATCQEVLDLTLMAYRLSEDERVSLPVIVNQDGFYLSFTREPVKIPESDLAKQFVGKYPTDRLKIRASAPSSQAVAVLGGAAYSYFRYETHLAVNNGLLAFKEIANEFDALFGRLYTAVESHQCDDAEFVFVMMGCFATKAKAAVQALRSVGWKIGLLRPRIIRPFPVQEFRQALEGKKAVAVIDQNISMGKGGILFTELVSELHGKTDMPSIVASFIGGLGGRDISQDEFFEIARILKESVIKQETPEPRLLYTENELRQLHKLQAIAHVEQEELNRS